MSFLISLVIGLASGAFLTYAATFRSGQERTFLAAVLGALLFGWLVPLVLRFPGIWSAIILGLIGVVVAVWASAKTYSRG